jgi:hypothetical protein
VKRLLLIFILTFSFQSFVNAEQEWIKKKEKSKWITKDETKKIQWITKKNKDDDLVFITLLPLIFLIFYIKRNYIK